jgi:hypothetical protein
MFESWLREAISSLDSTGHNSVHDFIVFWLIPDGAWIVFPGYMVYVLQKDIVDAMKRRD